MHEKPSTRQDIEVAWLTPDDIMTAIVSGNMKEWRSVGVLLGLVLPQLAAKKNITI